MKRSRKHMATASALLSFDNPDPFMMCQPAQPDSLCSQVTAKRDGVALGLSALIVRTVSVGVLGVWGARNSWYRSEKPAPTLSDCIFWAIQGGEQAFGESGG